MYDGKSTTLNWLVATIALIPTCLGIEGCAGKSLQHPTNSLQTTVPQTQPAEESWVGIYSSPSEIGGFSGTVLEIDNLAGMMWMYRMTFYSDVKTTDEIDEPWKSGGLMMDGEQLYLAEASAHKIDNKLSLFANVERYTRVRINGRTVLMRDDALEAYKPRNKLYDYGILIRVSDAAGLDLNKVKHESIKVLYQDAGKTWKDPFVHGPNER